MEQIRWEVAKCLFEINQLFSPFKGSTSHSAHCLSAEHRDEISSAPSPHGHTFTVLFLATQHNLTIWTTNSTLSLFPALECYSCETDSNNDECVGNQTKATCQADANQCATGFIQSGDNKVKDCDIHREKCKEYNGADNTCDISCCEGDLCNAGDIQRF